MYLRYLDIREDETESVVRFSASEETGCGRDCSPALLLRRSSGIVVLLVALRLETTRKKCEKMRSTMVE